MISILALLGRFIKELTVTKQQEECPPILPGICQSDSDSSLSVYMEMSTEGTMPTKLSSQNKFWVLRSPFWTRLPSNQNNQQKPPPNGKISKILYGFF